MLNGVINRLKRMGLIDIKPILQSILQNEELHKHIIYLNTIDQLFERGEDSLGRKLDEVRGGGGETLNLMGKSVYLENFYGGGYTPRTIQIKLSKGQRVDHVTLKDSGDYYDSYRISAPSGADYIMFITNPIKDGKDIEQEWGGYIVGLNTENTQWLIDEVKQRIIPKIKEALLSA